VLTNDVVINGTKKLMNGSAIQSLIGELHFKADES